MSWIADLAIGGLVVTAVVGSLIYLGKKGFFEPDDVQEDSQEKREELSDSVGSRDFRIPYRKRVSAWSGPYKVFVGSLGLLIVAIGAGSYHVLKTGSPAEQLISQEIRYAAIATIGVAGGVRLKSWFDSQIGRLAVVYERAGEPNLVDLIPYSKAGVRRRDGKVTVPEIAHNRLFGLFWRYRQVGEDRRLRGTDKPLSDVVNHLIPDHGDELPEGDGWVVTTHAEGDRILSGATSTADLTYASPNTLSDEQATQNREKMKRKDAELDAVKATNAELNKQIRKMQKKIGNEEYNDRQELIEDFDRFSSMFSTLRVQLDDQSDKNGSGPLQNGEKKEAKA